MKNFKTTLTALSFALFAAIVLFPSCKSKKAVVQTPPPAVVEAPKPVVETDTDGDGIPDTKDQCPDKAGVAANNGCPEVIEVMPTFSYSNIQFEFNSSVIKTSYYEVLDQIARDLKKYPTVKLSLNGHASAEGSTNYNMSLSTDRANAVKNYLVNAGVIADNLAAKGFGESMPVATDDSEATRQANRRVEIRKN